MNYAIRNTLILSILLVLVILGFLIGNTFNATKFKEIKIIYENNQKKLDDIVAANPDMNDQDIFIKSLKDLEMEAQRESKLIPQKNDPTITFKYLLEICDNFCPDLTFNFNYRGQTSEEGVSFNTYSINGTATIRTLYSFIYQLEKQYLLYVIESIKIREEVEEGTVAHNVNFTIVFKAYYEESTHDFGQIPFRKLKYKNIDYNPFYTRIHQPLPDELEKGYINTKSSEIIGLTPDSVFMKDQSGKVHILKSGDKVAYGILKSINWKDQYAIFQLNEIGITKNIKLYLNELKEESK